MRIIILTKEFPNSEKGATIKDGTSYYFYNLCKGLDKKNLSVTVLCKSDGHWGDVEIQGVTVYRISAERYFQESISLIRNLRDKSTVILTDGPAYSFIFGVVAKLLGLSHVALFHDCRIRYYVSRALAGHFDVGDFLGIFLTYASVLVNPDLVITVSEASKAELVRVGFRPSKISVTYNGISLGNIHPQEKQDLIVHIGLAPWKNLSRIIEAMPYVLLRVSTAQLYVVGPGNSEIYKENVVKLSLANKVRFFGLIPENEKQDILMKAKVLTLVSSLEGFGIPILEAWKYDVAPVLSRLPVFKEIAVDMKNCVMTDFDPKQIADSIVLLLQNDKLRMRLCRDGKITAMQRFSLEAVSDRFKTAMYSLEETGNA